MLNFHSLRLLSCRNVRDAICTPQWLGFVISRAQTELKRFDRKKLIMD
jgi:hypothetical protein